MRVSYAAILLPYLGLVAGQSVADLLESVSICAESCILPVLLQSKCNLTNVSTLASCLCPDIAGQRKISACTQQDCTYAEQISLVEVSSGVCVGYPIPSRSKEMENAGAALLTVLIPFVLLRLYSRIAIAKSLAWDDYTIIASSILAVLILIIEIRMSKDGFGKHVWNITPDNVPRIQLLFYISQIFYVLTQVLTKISLIVFYLRIFPQRIFRYIAIACIAAIGLHGFIFVFVVAFQCRPVHSLWNSNAALTARCLNKTALVLAGGVSSIYQDAMVLLLPIPYIKSLQIGTGKRVSLLIMFSIGSFACVTSFVRLKYVVGFGDYTDATWDNVDVYHWSVIEITTAIICACLPALRVLLGRFVPGVFGTPQTRANSTPLAASRQFDRSGHNRIEDCESSEKSIVGDPKENVSPASYSNLSPKSLEGSEGTELVDMMHGRALEQLYGKD